MIKELTLFIMSLTVVGCLCLKRENDDDNGSKLDKLTLSVELL